MDDEELPQITFHISVDPDTTDDEIQNIVDIIFQKFITDGLTYDPETGEILLDDLEDDEWMVAVPPDIIAKLKDFLQK